MALTVKVNVVKSKRTTIAVLILVEPDSWVGFDKVEVNFVAKKFTNVRHAIPRRSQYCSCERVYAALT